MSRPTFDSLLSDFVEEHNDLLRCIECLKQERDYLRGELQGYDWVPQERPSLSILQVEATHQSHAMHPSEKPSLATSLAVASHGFRHSVGHVAFTSDPAEEVDVEVDVPKVRSRSAAVINRDISLAALSAHLPETPRSVADHFVEPAPQLHRVWLQADHAPTSSMRVLPGSRPTSARKKSSGSWTRRATRAKTGDVVTQEDARCQWLVMRPSSRRRLMWDLLSTVVVLYDLVTIPLEAFRPSLTMMTILMDWLTTSFWICDMLCSAMSGYHADGLVEMRPKYTIRHYIRTSFPLDCFALTSDVLMLILAMHAGFDAFGVLRMNKTVRLVRVLRIIRITRLTKVQHVLGSLYDKIQSESFRAILSIGLLLFVIVLFNHYIACCWYLLGDTNPWSYERAWVPEHKEVAPEESGLVYWYFTSLHWSLTQFTPAGMEVHALNQVERIYSVCVLLFALVTFSSFVSSITGAMTRLRTLQQAAVTQHATLRRFFLQNKISADLGQGIFDYIATHRRGDKTKLREEEVTALKLLPQNLLSKVHEEIYMPTLMLLPIFEYYAHDSQHGLQLVCHEAMGTKSVMMGEYVFLEGKPGDKLYIVNGGMLEYTLRVRLDSVSDSLPIHREGTVLRRALSDGHWISEPSLWLTWMHTGRWMAMEPSEVVHLDSNLFQTVIGSPYHAVGREVLQTYAGFYADRFLRLDAADRTDLCFDLGSSMQLVNATSDFVDPVGPSHEPSSPRLSLASDPMSPKSRTSQPRNFFGLSKFMP